MAYFTEYYICEILMIFLNEVVDHSFNDWVGVPSVNIWPFIDPFYVAGHVDSIQFGAL